MAILCVASAMGVQMRGRFVMFVGMVFLHDRTVFGGAVSVSAP
jgi:hypothetical protein